jgi:hypothetical protein
MHGQHDFLAQVLGLVARDTQIQQRSPQKLRMLLKDLGERGNSETRRRRGGLGLVHFSKWRWLARFLIQLGAGGQFTINPTPKLTDSTSGLISNAG